MKSVVGVVVLLGGQRDVSAYVEEPFIEEWGTEGALLLNAPDKAHETKDGGVVVQFDVNGNDVRDVPDVLNGLFIEDAEIVEVMTDDWSNPS